MINLNIAKRRDRILVFIIDFLIYLIFIIAFGIFFGENKNEASGITITGFPAFVLLLIGIGLWPINEAFTGQTFGKKIVGLKVVNQKNKDISGTQSFFRFGFGLIDCFLLIGIFVSFLNPRKQRVGDLVANTVVVNFKK